MREPVYKSVWLGWGISNVQLYFYDLAARFGVSAVINIFQPNRSAINEEWARKHNFARETTPKIESTWRPITH